MNPGVSVVICTHNGAKRLPAVLARLRAQRVPASVAWEVLLVDNASTDETTAVARASWPEEAAPAPLRIVLESQLGLGHARSKGLREARYDIICAVDDDNWVCPEYVACVAEIFRQHPEVAVCGGPSEAVFEIEPPAWFENYAYAYAVGPQAEATGYVPLSRGFIWGAGMSVRRLAWQALLDGGIVFHGVGRQGKRLSAGEDAELCLAFLLSGWQLWYDTRLQLQHYMTAPRLNWQYLRRMYRGFGASEVGHAFYRQALSVLPGAARVYYHRSWQRQALSWLVQLLRHRRNWRALLGMAAEGEFCVLELEKAYGRLLALWEQRGTYSRQFTEIEQAPWRTAAHPQQLMS